MISGVNMHCSHRPVMTVRSSNGHYWLELSNGGDAEHTPASHIAVHLRGESYEALRRAADGFNMGLAPVVASIVDGVVLEAAE